MVLVVVFGVMAFACVPAFAGTPEVPELTVEDATFAVGTPSTEARLHGVLNPKAAGEEGTYQFLYKESKTGVCTGGGVAPGSPGLSFGFEREEYYETVTGLVPGREYAVCLRVESTKTSDVTVSPAVAFTTSIPPEAPETISPAKGVTATTAILEGVLNPKEAGEAGSYEFLYRLSGSECAGERASPEPPGVMSGTAKQAVSVPVTLLQPDATYTFCLLARNTAGETSVGPAVHFTTPTAEPAIESETQSSVKATGARLEALVNPNNQATECHFQYGTEASLTAPTIVPCEPASFTGIFGPQPVGVTVALEAKTTYYYRVIATNGTGTNEGTIQHFTTSTPPEAPQTREATSVEAATALLEGVLNPGGGGEAGSYEFVYRQSAGECQKTNPETGQPENENATPTTAAPAGKTAVTAPVEGLAPGTQYTFCLLSRNEAGETALSNAVSFTTHAVAPTVAEEFAGDVSSGSATLHGQINPGGASTTYRFEYGPTTAYGQTLPGEVSAGHEAVAVEAHPQGLSPGTLYHYRLTASNEVATEVTGPDPDRTFTTQAAGAEFVLPDGREWEMVSPPQKDGAEVYALHLIRGGDLQAAENGDAISYITTRPISATTRSNPWEPQVISRRGADGWVSEDINTPHNIASGEEWEKRGFPLPRFSKLEEYLVFSPDLSLAYVQPEGSTPLIPGEPPLQNLPELETLLGGYVRNNVTGTYSRTKLDAEEWYAQQVAIAQGQPSCDAGTSPAKGVGVDAVSRDGCYVYFDSESVLASGAISGQSNLYVSHFDGSGWTTTFISSLSGTGVPEWGGYVELSPDGRYVAFMSNLSLTGYDNRDASSGEPDEEVYLYDAAENRLVCASCNPTGARPRGQLDPGGPGGFGFPGGRLLVDRISAWEGHWLAGVLPEKSLEGFHGTLYQPRYVFDSGRLFFDSPDVLVPQAVNGLEDVYEYEPGGVGTCTSSADSGSSTYVPSEDGCVGLISAGTSSEESAFVDASSDGSDAFFITSSRLVSQDFDSSYDMYDAHVCSASVPCTSSSVSPAACETSDSCKAPPTPQPGIFGAPASSTFSGAGNTPLSALKPAAKKKTVRCAKGRELSHGKCVKKSKVRRKLAKGRK